MRKTQFFRRAATVDMNSVGFVWVIGHGITLAIDSMKAKWSAIVKWLGSIISAIDMEINGNHCDWKELPT